MHCIFTYIPYEIHCLTAIELLFKSVVYVYLTLSALSSLVKGVDMGRVRRNKQPPPDGWEMIEPTIEELDRKLREAETDPHEGKRKVEAEWPIFRIHHMRSRYIYDLYYRRKVISKVCFDFLSHAVSRSSMITASKRKSLTQI